MPQTRHLCRNFRHGWVQHGISDIGPNNTFLLAPFHDTSRNNATISARINLSDNVDKVKVNTRPKLSNKEPTHHSPVTPEPEPCGWRHIRGTSGPDRSWRESGNHVSRMSRWLLPSRKVDESPLSTDTGCVASPDCLAEARVHEARNKTVCVNFYWWPSIFNCQDN